MIFPRHLRLILLLLTAPVMFGATAKKTPTRPGEMDNKAAFKGAIVVDAATGAVLFEDRATVITPPASMTKLMTFAIVHDRIAQGTLNVTTPVKITNEDAKIGGTQVYLDPRETFPVDELLYAMMIQSANDAAHALARATAGSVPAFVELMNAKAKALGMTNTTFRTPHGLPPASRRVAEGDLTTPQDFAKLCQYLLKNTNVLQYTSVRTRDFGTGRAGGPQHMKNHNNLLGKVDGVDGLKTGYTEGAGYCLSATAQRNGRRVILVIMGSFGPNGQKDLGKTRDLKAVELLEKGFAALPAAPAPASAANAPADNAANAPANSPVVPAPRPATPAPAAASSAAGEPVIKFSIPKK
ncbi:MAG: D-alanyl-D-alanine carboxypeptidase family protein [Verrucomicrobiota bacterium]